MRRGRRIRAGGTPISRLLRILGVAVATAVLALAATGQARAASTGAEDRANRCACVATGRCCHLSVDEDTDGVPNESDNCVHYYNPNQEDLDRDGKGNPCDGDDDADGVNDPQDNCPVKPNPDQSDQDRDGTGDPCDPAVNTPGPPPAEAGFTDFDQTPPGLRVSLPRVERVASVVSGGLTVTVSCSEAATLNSQLIVKPSQARRMGMGSRSPAVLGTGSWYLGGRGRTYVVIELPYRAQRRLASQRRVRASVVTRAVDRSGNQRVATRAVTLRK